MSWFLRLWRTLPRQFQALVKRVVQRNSRLYRWLLFKYVDTKDRAIGVKADVPPAELRYRVSSSPDAEEFVRVGKTCANDIQAALLKVGWELASFKRVLDFGCGCGRTLVHLRDLVAAAHIDGTDIDAKAIKWCQQRLGFATFTLSSERPPINYPSETFDFIYAISVFTHLDENYQFWWLEELRRIAKPAAVVLLTVDSSRVGPNGFVFQRSCEDGIFPHWYQNAFHTKEYVVANFSKYFDLLGYFPQGMNAHQDVVVLQRHRDDTS